MFLNIFLGTCAPLLDLLNLLSTHAHPLLCQREWTSTQDTPEPPGKPLKIYQAQVVPRTGRGWCQKLLGDTQALETSRGAAQGGLRILMWRTRHPRRAHRRSQGEEWMEGSCAESVSLVKHTSPSARMSGGGHQGEIPPIT